MRTVVAIPARMASSRYPGKPLAMIAGLPMIEHVRRRALLAEGVDVVVVATCDREIFDVVVGSGGRAVMTSPTHERSTERVAEAMRSLDGEIVVALQGDEPLVLPDAVQRMVAAFREHPDIGCASLLSPLESDADYANPNIVKAACDQRGFVLYFSRAPVPHYQKPTCCPIYRETGIRAFRADFLQTYVALPETPFERAESVDMLRVLEHGFEIFAVVTHSATLGVDHPEDVAKAEGALWADPVQRALHERITQRDACGP